MLFRLKFTNFSGRPDSRRVISKHFTKVYVLEIILWVFYRRRRPWVNP